MATPSGYSDPVSPRNAVQLDLFARLDREPASSASGISLTVARASVSPGWWGIIGSIYSALANDAIVRVCREEDGVLLFDATAKADGRSVAPYVQRLVALAARTCGCCGTTGALPYRAHVDGPTRAVCATCKARLQAGESFLAVADGYWRLDGSKRATSHTPRVGLVRQPSAPTRSMRQCTTLAPDELRATIAEIRAAMAAELVGQDDAVSRLALLAGLHVGAGLPRGGRALILGPSGAGKSTAALAMVDAMKAGGWDVPAVYCEGISLTSPGWSGAPSIGDLIQAALRGGPLDSPRARRAVVVIDELHHIGLVDGLQGNQAVKRQEVLSSLLGLLGGGTVHLGDGTDEWSSREALVIGMGAFTGFLDVTRPPTVHELVRAGLPLELATRFEEVVRLRRLPERELVALLRRWPAVTSLVAVCERLGHSVRIHDEVFRRAARAVMLDQGGATARTAGGWIVVALREALTSALSDPDPRELVLTPDSLTIPSPPVRRLRPDDPPDDTGGWDATVILTRR